MPGFMLFNTFHSLNLFRAPTWQNGMTLEAISGAYPLRPWGLGNLRHGMQMSGKRVWT
jgi:hypothetical protein